MGSILRGKRYVAIGAAAVVMALVPSCGGDDETSGGTTGSIDTGPVEVTLKEFVVGTIPASAPAGSVTFEVSNIGPDDVHEFVVISTDLGPADLPTGEDGAVLETGEGMEVIDEIEDLAVDANETLTVELQAGPYVFICNIYDKKEKESHYQEGMRTSFVVE